MGFSTSLAAYNLRVRPLGSREYAVLHCFDGQTDMLDVVREFLYGMRRHDEVDEGAQVAIRSRRVEFDEGERCLYGIVESGQYGVENDIRNVQTGKRVYRKRRTDADMLPFYFQFRFRHGADEGMVLLQRNSSLGVFSIVKTQMEALFNRQFPAHRIDLSPVIPEEVIEERLRKGEVTKVRFIKLGRHEALEQYVRAKYDHKESAGIMEFSISPGAGNYYELGSLIIGWRKRQQGQRLIELPEFDYDTMKVEFELEGKRQTVDLDIGKMPRAYFQVDNEVVKGRDGFPEFDSIHQVANGLLADLAARMYRGAP